MGSDGVRSSSGSMNTPLLQKSQSTSSRRIVLRLRRVRRDTHTHFNSHVDTTCCSFQAYAASLVAEPGAAVKLLPLGKALSLASQEDKLTADIARLERKMDSVLERFAQLEDVASTAASQRQQEAWERRATVT